jgi:hypothetical protein
MQVAVSRPPIRVSNLIVFPIYMGAQAPIPPEQPQQSLPTPAQHTWWQQHGTTATWAAIVVTALIGLANIGTTWHFHNADSETKVSDEHIRSLVEDKFKPLNRDVFEDKIGKLSDKIDKLSDKIDTLSQRVSNIEGGLDKRVSSLEQRAGQQTSLAKLVLGDLQRNLNAIDRGTPGYWPAAADLINVRSQVSVGADFQTLSRADIPNCTNHPPTPMEYRMTSEEEWSTKEETNRAGIDLSRFVPAIYENCRFVLGPVHTKSTIFG